MPNGFYEGIVWKPVTIADAASISDSLSVFGYEVVAIQQPASCEGTAFTFQADIGGDNTFADVQTATAELSLTKSATVAQVILLGASKITGVNKIKVRTGTSAVPTAQTGAVTLRVGMRAATDG